MFFRKSHLLALVIFLAGFPACGGPDEPAKLESPPPRRAEVTQLELVQIATRQPASGTVKSRTSATIAAKMMGQILSVTVREGDRVRTGQLLVELDSRDPRAALDKATAGRQEASNALLELDQSISAARAALEAAASNAELAQATSERFEELYQRKSVSRQEFDEVMAKKKAAQAAFAQAQAMLAAAESRKGQVEARIRQAEADEAAAETYLSYARLQAPINGIVTEKRVDPGDLASPGMPLLVVEDDQNLRLEAFVEESRISSISLGQEVEVQVESLGLDLIGKVVEIGPQADPATHTFAVRIDLPYQSQLKPGLFGRAGFPGELRDVLALPQTAVARRGQLTGVFVLDEESIAHFRIVELGGEIPGNRIEVLSGLEAGETIVTSAEGLSEGTPIQTISNTR